MLRKSAGIGPGYCFPTAVCFEIVCPTLARLIKEAVFFFVRTSTGFDHTQLTRVVAWPSPTLLLLARSGSQRCSFEHLQVVVPHTFVAKVASTPLGPCILYSSPPAREHCTGLPADHAYCTAVCQRVCHVQDSSRVSSISLRIWAEPEAATQREQEHGGNLQRVSIVHDSQLIMTLIQQRSSACVMHRKPFVCTPSRCVSGRSPKTQLRESRDTVGDRAASHHVQREPACP